MAAPQPQPCPAQNLTVPAKKIAQHLRRNPYDLIDARRLLRRFQASGDDFRQALNQVEQVGHTQ